MNVESVRLYCLSLPLATEDFPFGGDVLAFRVEGRIFAMVNLERTEWFVVKCEPDYALTLRDAHPEITAAYHLNKRHWNQVNLYGALPDSLVESLIRHSYAEVVARLPRRVRDANPAINTIR